MNRDILTELHPVFYPRSVAVLGASNTPRKVGNTYVTSLQQLGFPTIYPINPREKQVLGLQAYRSVLDVPGDIDQAIITLPFEAVQTALEECLQKGVRVTVLNSSGFAEKGRDGARLQTKMVTRARERGMRIIGPNCMGVHNISANLSFDMSMLPKADGPVGVISHSGSMTAFITRALLSRGIGCGKIVSSGNDADLSAADFLEYYGEDPHIGMIVGYLEGVSDGRRFLEVARRVSQRKPVLLWKGGVTARGARAAASHTGNLAGSGELWQALFRQAGVTWLNGLDDMADAAFAFWSQPLPRGPRVAIITSPGGPGVTATDACIQAGLEMAELSSETKEGVRRMVGDLGTSIDNPLDLGMGVRFKPQAQLDASVLADRDPNVDVLVSISRAGMRRDYTQSIAEAGKRVSKPFVVALFGETNELNEDDQLYNEAGIPFFFGMNRTAQAVRWMLDYARFLQRTGNAERAEAFRGISRG